MKTREERKTGLEGTIYEGIQSKVLRRICVLFFIGALIFDSCFVFIPGIKLGAEKAKQGILKLKQEAKEYYETLNFNS